MDTETYNGLLLELEVESGAPRPRAVSIHSEASPLSPSSPSAMAAAAAAAGGPPPLPLALMDLLRAMCIRLLALPSGPGLAQVSFTKIINFFS